MTIDNKDIGFVNAGQAAEVKLETFPFTRYGTVPATVKRVTADAVTDEKRGAIFPATLTLARARHGCRRQAVALSAGDEHHGGDQDRATANCDFLLSPIQRAGNESLRER